MIEGGEIQKSWAMKAETVPSHFWWSQSEGHEVAMQWD